MCKIEYAINPRNSGGSCYVGGLFTAGRVNSMKSLFTAFVQERKFHEMLLALGNKHMQHARISCGFKAR